MICSLSLSALGRAPIVIRARYTSVRSVSQTQEKERERERERENEKKGRSLVQVAKIEPDKRAALCSPHRLTDIWPESL